ncbi:MAG TPA: hypothetical protein VHE59_20960 [Mucilaginibacter sp.]|nr:hypothetical protein [Mucilaginibacter sp.]
MEPLQIIPADLLPEYRQRVDGAALQAAFDSLHDAEISTGTFSFYTSVSAIASSRIEGEQMEVDSYIRHKMLNVEMSPTWCKSRMTCTRLIYSRSKTGSQPVASSMLTA